MKTVTRRLNITRDESNSEFFDFAKGKTFSK